MGQQNTSSAGRDLDDRYVAINRTVGEWRDIIAELRFSAELRVNPAERRAAGLIAARLEMSLPIG